VGATVVVRARSASKYFRDADRVASGLPNYQRTIDGGFAVAVAVDDTAHLSALSKVLGYAFTWRETTVEVDGRKTSPGLAYAVVSCWLRKATASRGKQRTHCIAHYGPSSRWLEEFDHPCIQLRGTATDPPVRWADHAEPVTDHETMIARVRDRARTFEHVWCPGYDLEPVLVRIRRLPRSRRAHLARMDEKKRRAEDEIRKQLDEIEHIRALTAHMAGIAEYLPLIVDAPPEVIDSLRELDPRIDELVATFRAMPRERLDALWRKHVAQRADGPNRK
jgi:hypothetical protein